MNLVAQRKIEAAKKELAVVRAKMVEKLKGLVQ